MATTPPFPWSSTWGSKQEADLTEDALDRLSDDYQEMAQTVAALSLNQLRREYQVVEDIEDALD